MRRLTTAPPAPAHAPDARGDGASGSGSTLAEKAAVLCSGETGVRIEMLALFAEPLFDHYHLDPSTAFELAAGGGAPDETVVAALEAARVLWSYLSLEPAARDEAHGALADYMLGANHAPEDEVDLEHLLERMEEQWDLLTPEDRELAEAGDGPAMGFHEVIAHPAFVHPEAAATRGYGPDRLSEIEAQALFAQPLLDAAEDPDEMEAVLERAHAYWELARLDAGERDEHLAEVVDELAGSRAERAELETEARRMLERFDELFRNESD